MFLKKLSVVNYKNIAQKSIEFTHAINCFVGENGVGKTSLLDAIYHLGMSKSYFNPTSSQNIKHGENFYLIEGLFEKEKQEEFIVCSVKKGSKKVIKRNGKPYDKISDHIGKFPMVIISPSDQDLISEGSEIRRRFIDSIISQHNSEYLHQVIAYQHLISQRNALLKYFAQNQTFNADTLSVYDEQLFPLGENIYNTRKRFIEVFTPMLNEQYQTISGGKDNVTVKYHSALNSTPVRILFQQTLKKDLLLQYTSQGVHKDDLLFEIDQYPIKKFGSQGQQKSFLIALKLTQFELLKNKNFSPILLLDDIFDKLDENRVTQIVKLVSEQKFGQIFISDTHYNRTEETVQKTGQPYSIFKIQ